jgi:alkylated DNA repair dioxygenase AlkB
VRALRADGVDLTLPGGTVIYIPQLFEPDRANELFHELMGTIPWRQEWIVVYGKRRRQPRLTAWFADDRVSYTYSGLTMAASPWPQCLKLVRAEVEQMVGIRFAAALANLYRDGRDGVSWHADDEPELGPAPIIASVSFGAPRVFQLRRRDDHQVRHEITLASGSLLLMAGETQRNWTHQIPRTSRQVFPRINVTFRTWAGR